MSILANREGPSANEVRDVATTSAGRTIAAAIIGTAVGAILFGIAGAISERAVTGAAMGGPLGAVVGYGLARRWFGTIVVWIAVFAVGGLVLVGCDAPATLAALIGAALGAFLGLTGWWRGTLVVVATWLGGAIGSHAGAPLLEPRPALGLLGAAVGFFVAWGIGYKLFPKRTARGEPQDLE
jgi:hypothetical protein